MKHKHILDKQIISVEITVEKHQFLMKNIAQVGKDIEIGAVESRAGCDNMFLLDIHGRNKMHISSSTKLII